MRSMNENGIVIYYWIMQVVLFIIMISAFTGLQIHITVMGVIIAMIICSDWLMTHLILKLSSELKIKEEIQARQIRFQNRIYYFKLLQLRNKYIRQLYHDLYNHLLTIDLLKQQGEKSKGENYVSEVKRLYNFETKICENDRINLASNLYRLYCARNHTFAKVTVTELKTISDQYENLICGLFEKLIKNNYLDNVTINGNEVILMKKVDFECEGLSISIKSAD